MTEAILESLSSIDSNILNGINYNSRDYARKILNYPAMMVPSVQESIIKTLVNDLPNETSMIDPFMGASNALTTGMRYGTNVYGQDINPLSVLISQVKTNIYSEDLNAAYSLIKERLKRSRSLKVDVDFKNIDKWFKKEVQIELSQIRRAILREDSLYIRKFFWVAFAEVIRLTGNDRTSTFKLHVRKEEDIANRNLSPKEYFLKICKRSIEDIFQVKRELALKDLIEDGDYKREVDINWGDSKDIINTDKSFNLLVTSPPYGDNHTTVTYGQFSYLPLQWIPVSEIDSEISINYLSAIQEIDKQSLGGEIEADYKNIESKIFSKSKSLKEFFNGFTDIEKKKARKVTCFINDLDITIDNIIQKMQTGSYFVWTIGNRNVNNKEVKNDLILIDLLKSKGIDLFIDLERDILSKRMPGRNNFSNTMNKEKILIFKMG
ncbi:hypothetical protein AB9K26_12810 [Psychroserpens sp. XS_ASV72]|uniref:hypothetical protein n=1 Tax=Psychroserpens sp. XS_ASV72 TaxID=3241293 RepID=UPI003517FEF7